MTCKDCEHRHEGCHNNCEDYKAYVAEKERRKKKINESKYGEATLDCVEKDRIKRAMKRRRPK
ncbi:MAG: hypothetical protein RSA49_05130 [Anaerovoracaceae bacterium]